MNRWSRLSTGMEWFCCMIVFCFGFSSAVCCAVTTGSRPCCLQGLDFDVGSAFDGLNIHTNPANNVTITEDLPQPSNVVFHGIPSIPPSPMHTPLTPMESNVRPSLRLLCPAALYMSPLHSIPPRSLSENKGPLIALNLWHEGLL